MRNFVSEMLSGTSHGMLNNPGGSGGISLRNDRENRSFRKVGYIYICFIYHLQSGVYAIYTTCASTGKMAPLVWHDCMHVHHMVSHTKISNSILIQYLNIVEYT